MKTYAFMPVSEAYIASDALVFPVEAHATFVAPTIRACVYAAVIPLSLNDPDGLNPSYCRYSRPP